jgi:hypothetical protein
MFKDYLHHIMVVLFLVPKLYNCFKLFNFHYLLIIGSIDVFLIFQKSKNMIQFVFKNMLKNTIYNESIFTNKKKIF